MKYLKLEQPFRAGFVYNNFMYLAAGEVIPAAIGVSWDDFVENRIFEPLGMKNSATDMARVGRNKNVATAHKKAGRSHYPDFPSRLQWCSACRFNRFYCRRYGAVATVSTQ